MRLINSLKNKYTQVVFVRMADNGIEFLKCSLIDPVVCYDPEPKWTRDISEAERFSGEEKFLLEVSRRYVSVPIVNYGSLTSFSLLEQTNIY